MSILDKMLAYNQQWAQHIQANDPDYFKVLASGQNPNVLLIGCSDSRVSPEKLFGSELGRVFIHRNIANVVSHTDFSALSALSFAINQLQVADIVVCGHHHCGGVNNCLTPGTALIHNWLRHIRDIARHHDKELKAITDDTARFNRLSELNVLHQVLNISETTVVEKAWANGHSVSIHGWIFKIDSGEVHDLSCSLSTLEERSALYQRLNMTSL